MDPARAPSSWMKGVLHVHSTYSDGEFTLAELRDVLAAAGCRFACVTDHADAFDQHKVDAYVHECVERSDDRFRFIPGLEYGCVDRMHILGYGSTSLVDSTDPATVIRHIEDAGGVSVIAHPRDSAFDRIASFDPVPSGIEVWNSKYDGRYAPRPGTFALLARLQAREPAVRAFYGQDLHWRKQYRGLFTLVDCARPDRMSVLTALRSGAFAATKDGLTLPSSGRVSAELEAQFARAQRRTQSMRGWVGRAKSSADALGLRLPASLKAQLRRLF
jgi:hypothetical protein